MADAERVRHIYDKQATRYDAVASRPWIEALRADLFKRARGDVLELGVGTGATFAHYPGGLDSLTGLDISEGMLAIARPKAADLPFPVNLRIADFQSLPFPDASFDTVACSLALCGIPDPARLFSEIRRVLRPGGTLAYVTWLQDERPFAPDRVFDALLDEYGFDDEPGDGRSGDIPSVERAIAELRRAGFADVTARRTMLEHDFGVDGYIGFLTEFDEEDLFASMARRGYRRGS